MSVQTTPLRPTAPSRLTVGAAAVQGTTISCQGVLVRAICPGQTIYWGVSNAVTTANGFPMADGDIIDLRVGNVNQIWFIASAAAQSVAFAPYALY